MPVFFGASQCFCGFLQGTYIRIACILLYFIKALIQSGVSTWQSMWIYVDEYGHEGLM